MTDKTPTQEDHEAAARELTQEIGAVIEKHRKCVDGCLVHEAGCLIEDEVESLIAAALSEAMRLAVEARDKEWCYAHGWREGAFDADGKPFSPERHAAIMQEAIKTAGEGVEEAVRVAVEPLREALEMLTTHYAEVSSTDCREYKVAKIVLRGSDAQATPAPEPEATHFCKLCGAHWRLNPPTKVQPEGSWSLMYPFHAGKCCDNAAMGDQIEPLPGTPPETGEKEPGR